MVDVDVVDDDVTDVLESDATAADDVDVGAAAVQGFVAVEDELLGEFDEHVGGKDDPERVGLDDGVAECAGARGDGVVVGGVGDDVDLTAFAAEGVLAESNGAVGEALAVGFPVGVAPPAVVYGVSRDA